MSDTEHDDVIARVARTLEDDGAVDPALKQRVMRQLTGSPAPRAKLGAGRWIVAVTGVAALAATVALVWVGGEPKDRDAPAEGQPLVLFQLDAPGAASVTMAGDFNDWDPRATVLSRTEDEGHWAVVVPLERGTYRYAFVIDGERWVADPRGRNLTDDFGGRNSVVTVGETR